MDREVGKGAGSSGAVGVGGGGRAWKNQTREEGGGGGRERRETKRERGFAGFGNLLIVMRNWVDMGGGVGGLTGVCVRVRACVCVRACVYARSRIFVVC